MPYVSHPIAVMETVSTVLRYTDILIAAVLHDTIEDTRVTFKDIEREFGVRVAKFVDGLTNVSKLEDGNRAVRKAIERDHLAKQDPWVQTVKVADLIDNTKSIALHDPAFAKIYLPEKSLLLRVLTKADPVLLSYARHQLINSTHFLGIAPGTLVT